MRRYDPAYRAMKAVIDSGDIGAPTDHARRPPQSQVPGHYTREMAITDTAVHDIDTARWLLGEEIVAAQVLKPRKNSLGGDLEDPLLLVFETESGVLVDIETNVNIRYGYDIRGEIVGEQGTVTLAESTPIVDPPRRFVHRPGHRRTGGSGSSAPTTSNSRNGSTPSPATASSAPAPGTGTPPPPSPTPPSRPCTTAPSRRQARRQTRPVRLTP